MKHLVLIGAGYSANFIARDFLKAGYKVSATTRDLTKINDANPPLPSGINFIETYYSKSFISDDCTHLVMTAPVSLELDPTLLKVMQDNILNLPNLSWIGYLSTTGVYGDQQGRWTDEETALTPCSERGHKRVTAEKAWQNIAENKGSALDILRLTGIYGPVRNSLMQLKNGRSRMIIKKDQQFNRIHVEDIAAVTLKAAETAKNKEIRTFNVSDGNPSPPQDVIKYAAQLLGVDPPKPIPFETADLSPMARSFYAENKKIDNSRMLGELGIKLKFPNYQAGLDQIFKEMGE